MSVAEPDALSVGQCLGLVRSVRTGRVVFSEQALPAVRLVPLVVTGSRVVIRCEAHGWCEKLHGTVVAVQADGPSQTGQGWWNVVVVGRAELVEDVSAVLAGALASDGGTSGRFLTVDIGHVTGQRLASGAPVWGELAC